mmetsp:Transcript_25228/g.64089  ORF Transcript_25228/g.64089 Transcript_25228/m.64089 type:complete len:209 (-) Transcript_25228:1046-1672(-)
MRVEPGVVAVHLDVGIDCGEPRALAFVLLPQLRGAVGCGAQVAAAVVRALLRAAVAGAGLAQRIPGTDVDNPGGAPAPRRRRVQAAAAEVVLALPTQALGVRGRRRRRRRRQRLGRWVGRTWRARRGGRLPRLLRDRGARGGEVGPAARRSGERFELAGQQRVLAQVPEVGRVRRDVRHVMLHVEEKPALAPHEAVDRVVVGAPRDAV